MRIFTAFELSEKNREKIAQYGKGIKHLLKRGRLTKEDNIHLTLEFIGETDEKRVMKIKEKVDEINFSTFSLTFNKLGSFKRKDHLLWVSSEEYKEIIPVVSDLKSALKTLGLEIDKRPYFPHITFGRNVVFKEGGVEQLPEITLIQEFKKITLFESIFTDGGVIYRKL